MGPISLLDQVTKLRIGRVGAHERPHKPALLLAILSMVESGRLSENRIAYGPELFELFRKYLEAVRSSDDTVNMLDPFWRLKSDGLLEPQAKPGFERAVAMQTSATAATAAASGPTRLPAVRQSSGSIRRASAVAAPLRGRARRVAGSAR